MMCVVLATAQGHDCGFHLLSLEVYIEFNRCILQCTRVSSMMQVIQRADPLSLLYLDHDQVR